MAKIRISSTELVWGFFTRGSKHSTIAHRKCPSLGEARRGYSETASKDLRFEKLSTGAADKQAQPRNRPYLGRII